MSLHPAGKILARKGISPKENKDTMRSVTQTTNLSAKFLYVIIFFIFGLVTLSGCSGKAARNSTVVSQSELEEKYGIRVNLVAVTAIGGLVDVRLKFTNGAKAASLLQDPANFPVLKVSGTDVTLNMPEDNRPPEISFEDDGNLFLMYPNAGNAVKPGTEINIIFGDLQVEAIQAK